MAENKKTIFRGVGTALITPMRDGEVDYPALRTLIDRQVELGADALVICGTTGESATLSDTERRRCIASAIEYTDGRVPVIAGTGSNNIEKAASLSRYASDAGADALLVVTPYYNKATPEGLCRSFLHIARSASAPLILYNVPSRTGCDIPISVYRELARDERIVAVKEASGNPVAAQKIIAETDGRARRIQRKRRACGMRNGTRRRGSDIGGIESPAGRNAPTDGTVRRTELHRGSFSSALSAAAV